MPPGVRRHHRRARGRIAGQHQRGLAQLHVGLARSALWSIAAKTFMPFAERMPVRREAVLATGLGLTLVVICVWVQSAMAGLLSVRSGVALLAVSPTPPDADDSTPAVRFRSVA